MPATFKGIKRLKIEGPNGGDGKIGPCFVYGLAFSQGYTASPGKLVMNLVAEDGQDFSIDQLPNVTLDDDGLYIIKVDNSIIFRGYTHSVSIEERSNQKVGKVTLIDRSVRLDQYGIGLHKRHGSASGGECVSAENREYDIACVDIYGDFKYNTKVNVTEKLDDGGVTKRGNVWILGSEKPSTNADDVKDVAYGPCHFKAACNQFGSVVKLPLHDVPETYKERNYTGSFREVLNSVCSDAGMTFYYDPVNDTIQFISLETELIDMDAVKALKNQEDIIVNSYNETETYEGSFANQHSVHAHFPAEAILGTNVTRYVNVHNYLYRPFDPVGCQLGPAGGPVGIGAYGGVDVRNNWALMTGMIAKVNSELAKLHAFYQYNFTNAKGYVNVVGLSRFEWNATSIGPENMSEMTGLRLDECVRILQLPQFEEFGASVYFCEIDSSAEEAFMSYCQAYIDPIGKYYVAEWHPGNLRAELGSTHCDVAHYDLTPQPQWVHGEFVSPGWYYTGESEWWAPQVDLGDQLQWMSPLVYALSTDSPWPSMRKENHTHILIIPDKANFYGPKINEYGCRKPNAWYGETEGDYDGANIKCVPSFTVYNPGKGKRIPCPGSGDNFDIENACDQFLDEQIQSQDPDSEGLVCGLETGYIRMSEFGIEVETPWYNGTPAGPAGYKSVIKITFPQHKRDPRPKEEFMEVIGGEGGNDFEKINISDFDVTSSIFDPARFTQHKMLKAEEPQGKFGDFVDSAKAVFSDHRNPLKKIDISFNGFPDNLGEILDPSGIDSFSFSYGEEGITIDVSYATRPATPPKMDYFSAKQWNQRRVNS